jgi:hypothetical protein
MWWLNFSLSSLLSRVLIGLYVYLSAVCSVIFFNLWLIQQFKFHKYACNLFFKYSCFKNRCVCSLMVWLIFKCISLWLWNFLSPDIAHLLKMSKYFRHLLHVMCWWYSLSIVPCLLRHKIWPPCSGPESWRSNFWGAGMSLAQPGKKGWKNHHV